MDPSEIHATDDPKSNQVIENIISSDCAVSFEFELQIDAPRVPN